MNNTICQSTLGGIDRTRVINDRDTGPGGLPANSFMSRAFVSLTGGTQPDDSPSSSSSSSSESEDTDSTESSSGSGICKQRNHRSKKKRHGKHNHVASTILKPIAPEKYNGTPDARVFHKFMSESIMYVEQGQVHRKWQVFIIARYLTGHARDFYNSTV